jgi:hypothetical protein
MLSAPDGSLSKDDVCPGQTSRNPGLKDTKSIYEHQNKVFRSKGSYIRSVNVTCKLLTKHSLS